MPVLQPTIQQHHRAAQRALAKGDPRAAHEACLAILREDPTHADAWFLCGVIAAGNGQHGKAIGIFERALSLEPDNPEYLGELARSLVAERRPGTALVCARQALAANPDSARVLGNLGTVLSHCAEHEEALPCFRRACDLLEEQPPADTSTAAEAWFNFGASLKFNGDFEASAAAFERALTLQPALFKAHSALAQLQRQSAEQNHLPRLQALRPAVKTPADQLHLGHALAKELEDLGDYQASMDALAWGKAPLAAVAGYDPMRDSELFDALVESFPAALFSGAPPGCGSDEPIFVVGMPRTGTTLVERILGGHSKVFAAGELAAFPVESKRLAGTPSAEVMDRQTLEAARGLDPRRLGQAYLDATRPRTGHTPHFVDKLPLNIMYLGLIRLALPRAKLVCLRRDPMDTCLSNYRQLFATNFPYYQYNYDLLDCGRYYLGFDRLLRHWQASLPGGIHEVRYEKLVSEPEATARALLAYCGLAWEPGCLDLERTSAAVATASAVQVRQPIYRSSVDRWRRYGDAVQPLYALLREAGLY
jgi:Tfp pilus assembly protein PilF